MADRLVQVALVSQAEALATAELERFAAALQEQIDRDLAKHWGVTARVSVYRTVTDVPVSEWPVIVQPEIARGTLGYHGDHRGQPYALVTYPQTEWTVTASHECLEMLVDPHSNRVPFGQSPKPGQGQVNFLVQVCDPCRTISYEIDGVPLSDFVTPAYYDGSESTLDVHGAIGRPLEVLENGMLTWREPETKHWWQLTNDGTPDFRDLGVLEEFEPAADEKEPEPAELDGVGALPGAANDQFAGIDRLGFRDYVIAFADLIESPHTEPPITIGIYGTWGSGKSFLLRSIEDELLDRQSTGTSETPRVHVVCFNAWEYSSSAAIWPSLVRKIVVCVEKEVRWRFPGRFLRKLWRNLCWELRQERGRILGALIAASLLGALVLWGFDFRAGPLVAAAAALGGVGLLKVVADTISSPLSRWMAAVLTSGEYGEQIGVMSRIQSDLQELSRLLAAENGRFVVMIDDLDRCEPDKVVEVLQAINLLLNFESFVVCLGIDARLVTGAIDRHYGGLLAESGASGYEYLDKIVQIPFRIPRPIAPEVKTFVSSQLREAVGHSNGAAEPPPAGAGAPPPPFVTVPSPSALAEDPPAPPEARPVAFDAREIEAFEDLAPLLEPNPRHLKRLINVYRLVRSLAGVRHVGSSVNRDPEGVIVLLTLAAQWPYTAAAMLDQLGPIVDAEAAGGSWPEGPPLRHLRSLADIDTERQRELDRDPRHLERLLAQADDHLGWKALDSLRRYVVNFNPAVEEELRRGRQIREETAASD
jgi:Cdc6-like AAA superfamily ATPase